MASFTGTKIKDTYKSILKVADNGELEAAEQEITDGNGNGTGVSLNTSGDVTATGTVAFGSLKDSGENITITKFVDEADGIGSNDNDTSIPTSAAVKDYVDNNITAQDLDISDGTNAGSVDLDSQSLIFTGDAGVSATVSGQTLTLDSSALQSQITSNDSDITALQAQDIVLQDNIDAEETARIAADTTLQSNIDAEAATRLANDNTLQTNIDNEEAARIAADTSLQGQITSNDSDITALQAADVVLQTNIDNEESARISADTTLQSNIDSEASTRASADSNLQSQITANDGDITTLQAADVTLQNNIDSEASARASADTTLQSNIDAEASTRSSADTTLQGNIDTEEAARIAADSNLQSQITSNDTDISGLDSRLTTAEGNITSNDSDISALQSGKQDISEKGQANGYASLDSGAKIPIAQLPDSVVGQVEYQGTWNASTDTPSLPAATGVKGHYYVVSVGGTYETITYAVGDWVISNGTAWEKVDNTDAVTTVFGRLGAIVANESDYSGFYPLLSDLATTDANVATNAANIASNDTDISNLQSDKYDKTGGTISGSVTVTGDLSATNLGGTLSTAAQTNITSVGTLSSLTVSGASTTVATFTGSGNATALSIDNTNVNDWGSNLAFKSNGTTAGFIGTIGSLLGNTDKDISLYAQSGNGVRFYTNGNNERMRIDASGRVGIGASSLSQKLTLRESGATEVLTQYLNNSNSKVAYSGLTSTGRYYLATNDEISFHSGASYTERLRITSSGNVGIGTSSPNAKIESNQAITFSSVDTFGQLLLKSSGGGTGNQLNFGVDEANSLAFLQASNRGVGDIPLVLQRYNGNVGIGTSSPAAKLQVFGGNTRVSLSGASVTTDRGYEIASGNVVTGKLISNPSSGELQLTAGFSGYGGYTTFYTNGAERMRIDSSGNVGIGTSSPSSATWSRFLQIEGTYAGIVYNSTAGGSPFKFSTGVDDDVYIFRDETNSATRMVINSSGNVGIGRTSSLAKLDVNAGTTNQVAVFRSTDAGAYVGFADDTTTLDGGIFSYVSVGAVGNDLIFAANYQEKGRFLAGGGLTFNGDTAAANALDDYEEGTFTPVYSTSGFSGTYLNQLGHYVKIGRMVHFMFQLDTSAVSSAGSGGIIITGLPFARTGGIVNRYIIQTSAINFDETSYNMYAYFSTNTSIGILYSKDNTGWYPADTTNFILSGTTGLSITGTYYV